MMHLMSCNVVFSDCDLEILCDSGLALWHPACSYQVSNLNSSPEIWSCKLSKNFIHRVKSFYAYIKQKMNLHGM